MHRVGEMKGPLSHSVEQQGLRFESFKDPNLEAGNWSWVWTLPGSLPCLGPKRCLGFVTCLPQTLNTLGSLYPRGIAAVFQHPCIQLLLIPAEGEGCFALWPPPRRDRVLESPRIRTLQQAQGKSRNLPRVCWGRCAHKSPSGDIRCHHTLVLSWLL